MNDCCPTCKRKFAATKSTSGTKDLNTDLMKCRAALTCLTSAMRWPNEHISFYIAVAAEYTRLSNALSDYRLLWAIYRRSSKNAPYDQAEQEVA